MPSQKVGRKSFQSLLFDLRWRCFSYERSSKLGRALLENNFVSLRMPRGSTFREAVEEIAKKAHKPIPIESLSDQLNMFHSIRGGVYFGTLGNILDRIASNYDNMLWWVSDNGLNMAAVPPDAVRLSPFDELAGRLTTTNWKDGKLSLDALHEIAHALDEAGFSLLDQLQPASRKRIAQHNQKYSKKAIKTFHQAVCDQRFVYAIRRRMYIARQKFESAYSPIL